uniref:S-adenosylmethionine mitochondrial carrier protein-like n=1 Tax=Crassostrea virginica TaxID=6565 RepID=A0A8B8B8B9_CRAVI|nr:S-adenosylmethionine mitochondrial carrier protein-like [Crassostrea virginica]XP_022298969.1 S-adenosylmethionine mitochondrial carrier protein-like [Crassostrea virginica]
MDSRNALVTALAGGCAGMSVDVTLFPLDTVKTRLQSEVGFARAGGFRGIYSGLSSVIAGSFPTAGLFFCAYEGVKVFGGRHVSERWDPAIHMTAASAGEVTACLIRVPVEVVKQRAQASRFSSSAILSETLKTEGVRGLYRGYISTVLREIPFSFIQFPLWEYLKKTWSSIQGNPVDPWQSSICGAFSGCVAAGITTPLDVAKTRIMLAETGSALSTGSITFAIKAVYRENGMRGLFAGTVPRMLWITVGGAIFLGVYDKAKLVLSYTLLHENG